MLIKNFFFNLYILSSNLSFYLFLAIVFTSYLLLITSLRNKFFLFVMVTILYSIWGFFMNLDGMMLILLITEFTIVLLFLMTYIQLYSNYSFLQNSKLLTPVFLVLVVVLISYSPLSNYYNHISYYNHLSQIVSSDFFILYHFLFDKLPLLIIFITLIISFFSLFFIIFYFNLKLVKLQAHSVLKSIYFLRKQNLIKQTNFKNKTYTFQN